MLKMLSAAACLAIAAVGTAPAFAQDALTGEMANSQYLVGTWYCAVTETMPSTGMRQENGTLTFAMVPGNALSQVISTPTFSGLGYLGYNSQSNKFFANSVNSMGGISTETADRGTPGHNVFIGTASEGGQTAPSRDTADKLSDTRIHYISEINIAGNWTKVVDVTCTKR